MEDGGAVPAKFEGFSKLPEKVQQKMNPDLAQKYEDGAVFVAHVLLLVAEGSSGVR